MQGLLPSPKINVTAESGGLYLLMWLFSSLPSIEGLTRLRSRVSGDTT
jgi:hypothetical protein